jgi:hypothetical protein
MRTLPTTMVQVLAPFLPLFSDRVWADVSAAFGRCDPGSGKEDRSFRSQGGWPARRTVLLSLPSGLELCCVVEPRDKPRATRVAR